MENERLVILSLCDQDGLDVKTHTISIMTSLPTEKIIPSIMAASQDYLNTPDGRQTWEYNNHCFNFGDFDLYVGDEFCIPHGFHKLNDHHTVIEEDFNLQLGSLEEEPAFIINLPSQTVQVMAEDIDDIMESAMTGCTYWCEKAEPVGGYLGEYASEQISNGGTLKFYPIDDEPVTLTKEQFQAGLHKWLLDSAENKERAVQDGRIEPGQMDANDGDLILQYALFDELIYS